MRKFVLIAGFVAGLSVAHAQSPAIKPFDLNMERVTVTGGKNFGASKTYLVPSYNIVISASGDVWSQKGGSQAHAKFFVDGLEAPLLRGLAQKVQADLVAKMRDADFTVLTYDDVKSHPDVAGRGRDTPDEKLGFPTRLASPLTFIIVAPTDEQQFNDPIQGAAWPFRRMAKDKDLVVIVPEITFSVPQVFGMTTTSYKGNEAGVTGSPAMHLFGARVFSINAKGGAASILVKEHGTRPAAEVAGVVHKLKEDKTEFSATWKRTSGDFSMELDPVAFSDGVLRVGYAINTLIVGELRGKSRD